MVAFGASMTMSHCVITNAAASGSVMTLDHSRSRPRQIAAELEAIMAEGKAGRDAQILRRERNRVADQEIGERGFPAVNAGAISGQPGGVKSGQQQPKPETEKPLREGAFLFLHIAKPVRRSLRQFRDRWPLRREQPSYGGP
jgi:hypothetical protein